MLVMLQSSSIGSNSCNGSGRGSGNGKDIGDGNDNGSSAVSPNEEANHRIA